MNDNTDLPPQPNALQQPPLMKKKSILIFIAVVILLLIVNLRYFGFLIEGIILTQRGWWFFGLLGSIHHFLALSILDLAVASFYYKENSKRIWKTIFILVFIVHIIPFGLYLLRWNAGQLKLTFFLETPPHFVGLFLVDLITVLVCVSQRYLHRFSRLAKGIIYACLIAAWLGVIAISLDPYRWFLITIDNSGY